MKMNKQTIAYIGTLVENKAKQRLAFLEAKRDTVDKNRSALRSTLDAEIEKVLDEMAKKVSAICRKRGFVTINWAGNESNVKLHVEGVREYRSKLDEEFRAANTEVERFRYVIEQKKDEVIARLSLGGTAADLDEIIGAIEF